MAIHPPPQPLRTGTIYKLRIIVVMLQRGRGRLKTAVCGRYRPPRRRVAIGEG